VTGIPTSYRRIATVLALLCQGCFPASKESAVTDFSLPATDGVTFRLGDHVGREVVLLVFFATWSKPSRSALLHLQRLYEDARDPDAGQCTFKHPIVDGGARYCGPGASVICY